jgi:hypothetical protein
MSKIIFKKDERVVYLGETLKPKHEQHLHFESLLTHGKVYILDCDIRYYTDCEYSVIYFEKDDRGEMGGYELKYKDIISYNVWIEGIRNDRLNSILTSI